MELEKLISKKDHYGGTNAIDDVYFGCSKDQLRRLVESDGSSPGEVGNNFTDINHLCSALKTSSKNGLNANNQLDMERRRKSFGSNKLETKESRMFVWFLWEAVQDQTLIILILAALVSIALAIYEESHKIANDESRFEEAESGLVEGIGIMVAVVMVVGATAGINYNRERQFRNLQRKLNEQLKCCVIREGVRLEIPTFDVLVGDVCVIRAGDLIPADGIVIKSTDLKVDESSHTGESDEVSKAESSIIYSGTHVIEGTCKMLVLAVGENSQQGVIFSLLKISYDDVNESEEKRSILHAKLCKITKYVTFAGTALAIVTFAVLLTRFCVEKFAIEGKQWEMDDLQSIINFIIISITLLVVAIPEGLPLAVILALAYSIKKMMRDNNLVRHLDSCETMGSATIICSDKTGTLTTNRMTVARCFVAGIHGQADEMSHKLSNEIKEKVAKCISVNSTASSPVECSSPMGSKTECALLDFVSLLGFPYKDLQDEEKQIKVYSFSSKRKWMATLMSDDGNGFILMVKGAPEMIMKRSTECIGADGFKKILTENEKKRMMREVVDAMAGSGLRTICLAYREIAGREQNWNDEEEVVNNLTCLAIIGIEDPVRPEVPEAIRNCRRAGIEVCMVSGDHLLTAKYVAQKCGLLREGDSDTLALSGEEFNKKIRDKEGNFDQTLFDLIWPKLKVLGRASPQDKFTLVSGLMSSDLENRRQVVAVTGDGTNDAPALKKAHVGLCMGISGTDVAKEASDIILIDDNFTNIVKSVIWGRHVHDSIAKFIQFQLTINVVSVVLVVMGAAILTDSPLRGVQMLWVNLLMDTLASLSLSTEDPSDDLLHRKPYCSRKSIISSIMLTNIVCHALYQLTILSVILWKGYEWLDVEPGFSDALFGRANAHYTFLFNTFVMMILFNEINSRKIDANINVFSGLHKSPIFIVIWVLSFVVQILLVQFGGNVFFTTSLSFSHWLWCIFLGVTEILFAQVLSIIIQVVNFIKVIRRSKKHFI